MPEIHYIPSAPAKDPEEFLLMAAWAINNRDRFEANTVMDLAQQAITAYIADTTQMKAQEKAEHLVTTCVQCGHKTTNPVMLKIPIGNNGVWARQPFCPDCAKGLHPKNPDEGVRQG